MHAMHEMRERTIVVFYVAAVLADVFGEKHSDRKGRVIASFTSYNNKINSPQYNVVVRIFVSAVTRIDRLFGRPCHFLLHSRSSMDV